MNKLTKVGCSALCGSLAAISAASAGDMTVTGGADMTWITRGGETTGNPLGIGSNFTIKGNGELDNGWTFDVATAFTNVGAYSDANMTIDMGGLGKWNINQGNSGNGISAYDDKMPTAWEESWGNGVSTGVRLALGVGSSMNVQYTAPKILGTTIALAYTPEYGAAQVSDKNTGVASNDSGAAYDATININPSLGTEILSGLNLFVGGSTIERQTSANDLYEGVAGVTYDIGPLSIGAQVSGDYTGVDDSQHDDGDNTYNLYKNFAYGVAFNVNDDFSISYGRWTARKAGVTSSQATQITHEIEVSSIQAAYTMGGASFRIADTDVDNAYWTENDNRHATVVSLGLAF